MILHTYFARCYSLWLIGVSAALGLILFLLDLVNLTDALDKAGITELLWTSALGLPKALSTILPLIIVISSAGFCILIRGSSELTAARSAGLSLMRCLAGPVLVASAVSIGALTIGNPLVASTSKAHDRKLAQFSETASQSFASQQGSGLWLRETTPDGFHVIYGINANGRGSDLRNAVFLKFDDQSHIIRRIEAPQAKLEPNEWRLRDAKVWPLRAQNPEANTAQHPEFSVPSNLSEAGIAHSFGAPDTIAIWNLPDFIAQLNAAGFSAQRHRAWLASECARPIFLVAMMLITAGFTMGHHRSGGTGTAVLLAVGSGFGLYFVRRMAMILGENGQLHLALAAIAPAIAALCLGLALLMMREDAG